MKIVLAGGTGQVGTILARAFHKSGDEVVILGRNQKDGAVRWDGKNAGPWVEQLADADVVINLAGRSVNCRYNPRNRREIMESRVDSVHAIGRAIQQVKNPPKVWLQASTATIYSHRFDAPNDEATGIIGGSEANAPDTWRFSIDVATAWETAVTDVGTLPKTRVVLIRSAMTMSPDQGGIFATLRRLARLGLGGRAGRGRQFISWIHETDFVSAVQRLIADEQFSGPVNICAPNPLTNREFMRELRDACGVRFGPPAAPWMLEIGSRLMRTETELILKSRYVVPRRLLDAGFEFAYPAWREAVSDLCQRSCSGGL